MSRLYKHLSLSCTKYDILWTSALILNFHDPGEVGYEWAYFRLSQHNPFSFCKYKLFLWLLTLVNLSSLRNLNNFYLQLSMKNTTCTQLSANEYWWHCGFNRGVLTSNTKFYSVRHKFQGLHNFVGFRFERICSPRLRLLCYIFTTLRQSETINNAILYCTNVFLPSFFGGGHFGA